MNFSLWDASALLRLLHNGKRTSEVEAVQASVYERGEGIGILVHTLRECFAGLTKPETSNGYELPIPIAQQRMANLLALPGVARVPDPSGAYPLWLELCARTEVKGLLCHDAYLAACALAYGVPIYALDRDFARFGVRLL